MSLPALGFPFKCIGRGSHLRSQPNCQHVCKVQSNQGGRGLVQAQHVYNLQAFDILNSYKSCDLPSKFAKHNASQPHTMAVLPCKFIQISSVFNLLHIILSRNDKCFFVCLEQQVLYLLGVLDDLVLGRPLLRCLWVAVALTGV